MIVALLMSLALTTGHAVCDDEHETEECASEQIAEATRNLSLPTLQSQFDAGVQVYRAVFDGGRHDRPGVSFERQSGQSPELVVYGSSGRILRREVGADVWDAVQERSRYVGRRLEPIPGYSRSCVVGSDVVVQIAKPHISRPNETSRPPFRALYGAVVIEASQNSCEGGLTWDYGVFLADLACAEIPECDAMGPRGHYMLAIQHLEAVFALRGDRLAAASLSADIGHAPSRGGRERSVEAAQFARWLEPEYGATLDWGGAVIKAERRYDDPSPDAISRYLADIDMETGGVAFEAVEIGADSVDIGWATGRVAYSAQVDGRWRAYQAPYRQVWLRSGENWRLWSMTVGVFETRILPED